MVKAEWIKLTYCGNWQCSNCKTGFVFSEVSKSKYRYCPYCGIKIENFLKKPIDK